MIIAIFDGRNNSEEAEDDDCRAKTHGIMTAFGKEINEQQQIRFFSSSPIAYRECETKEQETDLLSSLGAQILALIKERLLIEPKDTIFLLDLDLVHEFDKERLENMQRTISMELYTRLGNCCFLFTSYAADEFTKQWEKVYKAGQLWRASTYHYF